jgi:DNA-binding GntR family transcriptional regulator
MLSKNQIETDLDVSRTPVQEAFFHLEFQGLLVTKPQSGTFVFSPSPEDIKEIFEMRSCLKCEASSRNCMLQKRSFLKHAEHKRRNRLCFSCRQRRQLPRIRSSISPIFYFVFRKPVTWFCIRPNFSQVASTGKKQLSDKMVDEVSHSEHLQIARSFGIAGNNEVKSLLMQHLARFEECLMFPT